MQNLLSHHEKENCATAINNIKTNSSVYLCRSLSLSDLMLICTPGLIKTGLFDTRISYEQMKAVRLY